jgi:hypothetical protein
VTVCTNGEKYEGEYSNGLRVGFGIHFWSSGDCYIGQWESDRMEGHGLHMCNNGTWYLGRFLGGLKHGHGVFEWAHGDTYRGQFQDGHMAGYGVMRFTDGGVYEGQWLEGAEHGEGTFTHPVEGTQTGHWREGLPYGTCTQTLGNGDSYKGHVNKGVRDGEGVYTWAQDESEEKHHTKVEGTFKRDMISGNANFKDWEEGVEYNGHWRENLPDGEGKFSQKMNNTDASFDYEGGWSRGHRHGQGTATWPNGTKYAGEWHQDLRHGSGLVEWTSGNTFRGKFDADERHGVGVFKLKNGQVHNDRYVRGMHRERDDIAVETAQVPQSAETTVPPQSAGAASFAESGEFERPSAEAMEPPLTPTDGDGEMAL